MYTESLGEYLVDLTMANSYANYNFKIYSLLSQ